VPFVKTFVDLCGNTFSTAKDTKDYTKSHKWKDDYDICLPDVIIGTVSVEFERKSVLLSSFMMSGFSKILKVDEERYIR
jgi:hypothetical protein